MATEKRLIDAYAFYKNFVNTPTITVGKQRYVPTWRISDLIADAPTVDAVEVVHGRWISKECKPHLIYRCSECGDVWNYGAIIQMKYCPNCGAKMDGERKDNE